MKLLFYLSGLYLMLSTAYYLGMKEGVESEKYGRVSANMKLQNCLEVITSRH